jgi:AcrR family transcriptional regulator
MTRPSDSAIRPGLLAACTQPAMAGHLGGLSLKQLSQAVRISPRMLIYHFGSAEALVSETLIGVQQLMRAKLHSSLVQDQSRDTRKALRAMWDHCTSWEMLPFFRTYNFFISESLGLPGRNADFIEFSIDGMRNWIKTCLAYHQPGATAPKIQHFFIETFPDVSDQMSQSAHEEWAKVVSGLNTPSDTLPITYRGGTYNLQGTGIRNMLNLIAHLLPDPGLARVWPTGSAAWHEVAAGKLDRLCTLVSTPGRVFTWEVSGRRAIPGEFVTISFRINDIPTFVWDFADGHFAILPIRGGQNAQCLKEAKALPGVNEWVQG